MYKTHLRSGWSKGPKQRHSAFPVLKIPEERGINKNTDVVGTDTYHENTSFTREEFQYPEGLKPSHLHDELTDRTNRQQ